MDPDDDTPDRQGWGPGFVRGFELGLTRTVNALQQRMRASDFRRAGWTEQDITDFIEEIRKTANAVRP